MIVDLLDRVPEWLNLQLTVTPGHFREKVDIDGMVWILGDEEGDCPFWLLDGPVWRQFPNPHRPYWPDHVLPLGYTPRTRQELARLGLPTEKSGYTLAGQNTNPRRHAAFAALGGDPSPTFAGGLPFEVYIEKLWRASWAPAPAGNVRADSFRLWEALEAGAVPILDATTPQNDPDTWSLALGEHPFEVLTDWNDARDLVETRAPHALAGAWYTRYKRDLLAKLIDDQLALQGSYWWPAPEKRLTAVITASPLPSHPDFEILAKTVESVRSRLDVEICIAFDGPRETDDTAVYEEHIRRVAYHANHNWPEVWLYYTGRWKHQAGTLREVIPLLRPGALLMLEADTPLVGEIPWADLVSAIYTDDFDVIRLHYDTKIHPDHRYLTRGTVRAHSRTFEKTVQYSQRPHLTSTRYVSDLLASISPTARTYVEDAVYGPIVNSPWEHNRIVIYTPPGDIRRSYHLDGRAGVPKPEFWF